MVIRDDEKVETWGFFLKCNGEGVSKANHFRLSSTATLVPIFCSLRFHATRPTARKGKGKQHAETHARQSIGFVVHAYLGTRSSQ